MDNTHPRSPLHETAGYACQLLEADFCTIYEARVENDEKSFDFAGYHRVDGRKTSGPSGPGRRLSGPPGPGEPWNGLTSYVAYRKPLLRIDDPITEAPIDDDGTRVELDLTTCELETPGPLLCAQIRRGDQVIGVIRLLRRSERDPFTEDDEHHLRKLLSFLALLLAQEQGRRDFVHGLFDMAQAHNEDDVLERICAQAAALVHDEPPAVAVFLEDASRRPSTSAPKVYTFRAPKTIEPIHDHYTEESPGLTSEVLKTQKPLLLTDVPYDTTDGQFKHIAHEPKDAELEANTTRSFVAVPIFHPNDGDDVIGVIRLSSPVAYHFTRRDVDALEAIASQTAWIVRNLRGLDVLVSTLVDQSDEAIIAVDDNAKVTVYNSAAERLFGVPADEAKGQTYKDVAFGGDKELAAAFRGAIVSAERAGRSSISDHYAVGYRRLDDTEYVPIPVRVSASFLRQPNSDEVTGAIAIISDLSGPHCADRTTEFGPSKLGITMDERFVAELHKLTHIATRDIPILIRGESGTGKDLVAKEIDVRLGGDGPWRPVNCAQYTDGLFAGEVFGVEKDSATGVGEKQGLFAGGKATIFFDEIGDLSLACQAMLLRVLENRTVRKVGASHESDEPNDALVIAATNIEIEAEDGSSGFRKDLLLRFGERIHLPPLRERRADILLLAERFLREECGSIASNANGGEEPANLPIGFESDAIRALLAYEWTGNVRELQRVVRSAVRVHVETANADARMIALSRLLDPVQQAFETPWEHSGVAATSEAARQLSHLESRLADLDVRSRLDELERRVASLTRAPAAASPSSAKAHILELAERDPSARRRLLEGGADAIMTEAKGIGRPVGKSQAHNIRAELAKRYRGDEHGATG